MLDLLCPDAVQVVEVSGDLRVDLFASESALLARAGEERRREFATVRGCARTALGRLGLPPAPLLPGPRGAPRWPQGVVGSMTHCPGLRAAAVARVCEVSGIGIDAEPDAPLPQGVLDAIALPAELARLPCGGAVCWDRLLLCAKEAVYKAWFPLVRAPLGPDGVEVRIDPGGRFTARVAPGVRARGGAPERFDGRWAAAGGSIATVVVVPAVPPRRTGGGG